jgi:hypothetical protein
VCGLKAGGTGSGSYRVEHFGINGVESSGSTTRDFVSLKLIYSTLEMYLD